LDLPLVLLLFFDFYWRERKKVSTAAMAIAAMTKKELATEK
jgi:hypothetical protein